jgi:hypothetical protein
MIVNDGAPLPTTLAGYRQGVKVAWSTRKRWVAPAPVLPLTAPAFDRLSEVTTPFGRRIRLRLRVAGHDALMLRAGPEGQFLAARAGGSIARFGQGKADAPFTLRCAGRSCNGLVVDLHVANRRSIPATLIGTRFALPEQALPLKRARPSVAAPQYTSDASYYIVRTTL